MGQCVIGSDRHLPTERIDFTSDMALGRAADAAVTRQMTNTIEAKSDTKCGDAEARGSQSSLNACLPRSDHDHLGFDHNALSYQK